jgi:hypothetical protein
MTTTLNPAERAESIRQRLPDYGLFAGYDWRISPEPFHVSSELLKEFQFLGRVFLQFYRTVNLLYRQSATGKQPSWIAQVLDAGKPAALIELQRSTGTSGSHAFKNDLPRVIRPDILLTDDGVRVTELDSVPGGIGLTAWLNKTYVDLGTPDVIGGARGMLDGFSSIFGASPRVHVVISDEAKTYRPEMNWLSGQLGERFSVRPPDFTNFDKGDAVYRFFELFDLANVPATETILARAAANEIQLTPPPKTIFEEKALFALLWNRNLRPFWRQHLGESFFERLLKCIPYTWLVDPSPLPPHAAIPELNITDWAQLKALSQRERELILKVSGFSEHAWGARGVFLGSDLSHADWSAAIDRAIESFSTSPFVLQRYHKPRLEKASYYDFDAKTLVPTHGRVRLCPYYFVTGDGDSARPELGGILATICPPDKKIIHGMTEAILAPCAEVKKTE